LKKGGNSTYTFLKWGELVEGSVSKADTKPPPPIGEGWGEANKIKHLYFPSSQPSPVMVIIKMTVLSNTKAQFKRKIAKMLRYDILPFTYNF